MKRACTVLLLIAMTANCAARGPALAGPSGSGVATSGPQDGMAPDVWRQYAQKLPAGSTLRVHYKNTNPLVYGMPDEGLALYLALV